MLSISGWLSTVIGRKRFYMICVATFALASLLCGLAWSLQSLVLFRILQGLGGGGMATSEQAILADTFPPEKRGQAFAIYGVAVVVAPVIGPTLGGWITDTYTWHWVFLINVPMGLLSLFLVGTLVSEPSGAEEERARLLQQGPAHRLCRLRAGRDRPRLARIRARRRPAERLVRLQHDRHLCAGLGLLPAGADPLGADPRGSDRRSAAARPPAIRRLLAGDARHRRGADLDHAVPAADLCRRNSTTPRCWPDSRCRRAASRP